MAEVSTPLSSSEVWRERTKWGAGLSTAAFFGIFAGGLILAPIGSWALKKRVVTYIGAGIIAGGTIGAFASAAIFNVANSDRVRSWCQGEGASSPVEGQVSD